MKKKLALILSIVLVLATVVCAFVFTSAANETPYAQAQAIELWENATTNNRLATKVWIAGTEVSADQSGFLNTLTDVSNADAGSTYKFRNGVLTLSGSGETIKLAQDAYICSNGALWIVLDNISIDGKIQNHAKFKEADVFGTDDPAVDYPLIISSPFGDGFVVDVENKAAGGMITCTTSANNIIRNHGSLVLFGDVGFSIGNGDTLAVGDAISVYRNAVVKQMILAPGRTSVINGSADGSSVKAIVNGTNSSTKSGTNDVSELVVAGSIFGDDVSVTVYNNVVSSNGAVRLVDGANMIVTGADSYVKLETAGFTAKVEGTSKLVVETTNATPIDKTPTADPAATVYYAKVANSTYTYTFPVEGNYKVGDDVISVVANERIFSSAALSFVRTDADANAGVIKLTQTDGNVVSIYDAPNDAVATVYGVGSGSISYNAKLKEVALTSVSATNIAFNLVGENKLIVDGTNTFSNAGVAFNINSGNFTITGDAETDLLKIVSTADTSAAVVADGSNLTIDGALEMNVQTAANGTSAALSLDYKTNDSVFTLLNGNLVLKCTTTNWTETNATKYSPRAVYFGHGIANLNGGNLYVNCDRGSTADAPVNPTSTYARYTVKLQENGILNFAGTDAVILGRRQVVHSQGGPINFTAGDVYVAATGDVAVRVQTKATPITVSGTAKLTVKASSEALINSAGDIVIEGGSVTATTTNNNAISGVNITVSGGEVNATAGSATTKNYAFNASNVVTISGGKVEATAGVSAISAATGIKISQSEGKTTEVTVNGAANNIVSYGTDGVSISGGKVISTATLEGAIRGSSVTVSGGEVIAKADNFAIVGENKNVNSDTSTIAISGGSVTAEIYTYDTDKLDQGALNANTVNITGGTVTATSTADIYEGKYSSAIYAAKVNVSGNDTNVTLEAKDRALCANYSIAVEGGSVTATASNNDAVRGTLTVSGGSLKAISPNGYAINAGSLKLTGGTLTATSTNQHAAKIYGHAVVEGGTFNASSTKNYAIWSDTGNLTVSNGTINIPVDADTPSGFGILLDGDADGQNGKLIVNGGTINATVTTNTAINALDMEVSNGTVDAKNTNTASGSGVAIYVNNLKLTGGTVNASGNGSLYNGVVRVKNTIDMPSGTPALNVNLTGGVNTNNHVVGLRLEPAVTKANFAAGSLSITALSDLVHDGGAQLMAIFSNSTYAMPLDFCGAAVAVDLSNCVTTHGNSAAVRVQNRSYIDISAGSFVARMNTSNNAQSVFTFHADYENNENDSAYTEDIGLFITGGEVTGVAAQFINVGNNNTSYYNNIYIGDEAKVDVYYSNALLANGDYHKFLTEHDDKAAFDKESGYMDNAGWNDTNHWLTTSNWNTTGAATQVMLVLNDTNKTKVYLSLEEGGTRVWPTDAEPCFALSAGGELLILKTPTGVDVAEETIRRVEANGHLGLELFNGQTINLGVADETTEIIKTLGDLKIYGTGTLNVNSGVVAIKALGDLVVENVTLNVTSAANNWDTTVPVQGASVAISNSNVNVTAENQLGHVIWATEGALSINNARVIIEGKGNGTLFGATGLTIEGDLYDATAGTGTYVKIKAVDNAINTDGTLTITGGTIDATATGKNALRGVSVDIQDGHVTAAASSAVLYTNVEDGKISISGGTVVLTSTGYDDNGTTRYGYNINAAGAKTKGVSLTGTAKVYLNCDEASSVNRETGAITLVNSNGYKQVTYGIQTNGSEGIVINDNAQLYVNGGFAALHIDSTSAIEVKGGTLAIKGSSHAVRAQDGAIKLSGGFVSIDTTGYALYAQNQDRAVNNVSISGNVKAFLKTSTHGSIVVENGGSLEVSGNAEVVATANAVPADKGAINVPSMSVSGGKLTVNATITNTDVTKVAAAILVNNTTVTDKTKGVFVTGGELIVKTNAGASAAGNAIRLNAATLSVSDEGKLAVYHLGDFASQKDIATKFVSNAAIDLAPGRMSVEDSAKVYVYTEKELGIRPLATAEMVADKTNDVYTTWGEYGGVYVSGGQLEVYAGAIPFSIGAISDGVFTNASGNPDGRFAYHNNYSFTGGVVLADNYTTTTHAFAQAITGDLASDRAYIGKIGGSGAGPVGSQYDRSECGEGWVFWANNAKYQYYNPDNTVSAAKGILVTKNSDTEWLFKAPSTTNSDAPRYVINGNVTAMDAFDKMYSATNPVVALSTDAEYTEGLNVVESDGTVHYLDGVNSTTYGGVTYAQGGATTFDSINNTIVRVATYAGNVDLTLKGTNTMPAARANSLYVYNGDLSISGGKLAITATSGNTVTCMSGAVTVSGADTVLVLAAPGRAIQGSTKVANKPVTIKDATLYLNATEASTFDAIVPAANAANSEFVLQVGSAAVPNALTIENATIYGYAKDNVLHMDGAGETFNIKNSTISVKAETFRGIRAQNGDMSIEGGSVKAVAGTWTAIDAQAGALDITNAKIVATAGTEKAINVGNGLEITGAADVDVSARYSGIYVSGGMLVGADDAGNAPVIDSVTSVTDADWVAAKAIFDNLTAWNNDTSTDGESHRWLVRNQLGGNMVYVAGGGFEMNAGTLNVTGGGEQAMGVTGGLTLTGGTLDVKAPTTTNANAIFYDTEALYTEGTTSNNYGVYAIRMKGDFKQTGGTLKLAAYQAALRSDDGNVTFAGNAFADIDVSRVGIYSTVDTTLLITDNATVDTRTVENNSTGGYYCGIDWSLGTIKVESSADSAEGYPKLYAYASSENGIAVKDYVQTGGTVTAGIMSNATQNGKALYATTANVTGGKLILTDGSKTTSNGVLQATDVTIGGTAIVDIDTVTGNSVKATNLTIKDTATVYADSTAQTNSWSGGAALAATHFRSEGNPKVYLSATGCNSVVMVAGIAVQATDGTLVMNGGTYTITANHTAKAADAGSRTYGIFGKYLAEEEFKDTTLIFNLNVPVYRDDTSAAICFQDSKNTDVISVTDCTIEMNSNANVSSLFYGNGSTYGWKIDGGKITGASDYFWRSASASQSMTVTGDITIDYYNYSGYARKGSGKMVDSGVSFVPNCKLTNNSYFITTGNAVNGTEPSQVVVIDKDGQGHWLYDEDGKREYNANGTATRTSATGLTLNGLTANAVRANGDLDITTVGVSNVDDTKTNVVYSVRAMTLAGNGTLNVSTSDASGSYGIVADTVEISSGTIKSTGASHGAIRGANGVTIKGTAHVTTTGQHNVLHGYGYGLVIEGGYVKSTAILPAGATDGSTNALRGSDVKISGGTVVAEAPSGAIYTNDGSMYISDDADVTATASSNALYVNNRNANDGNSINISGGTVTVKDSETTVMNSNGINGPEVNISEDADVTVTVAGATAVNAGTLNVSGGELTATGTSGNYAGVVHVNAYDQTNGEVNINIAKNKSASTYVGLCFPSNNGVSGNFEGGTLNITQTTTIGGRTLGIWSNSCDLDFHGDAKVNIDLTNDTNTDNWSAGIKVQKAYELNIDDNAQVDVRTNSSTPVIRLDTGVLNITGGELTGVAGYVIGNNGENGSSITITDDAKIDVYYAQDTAYLRQNNKVPTENIPDDIWLVNAAWTNKKTHWLTTSNWVKYDADGNITAAPSATQVMLVMPSGTTYLALDGVRTYPADTTDPTIALAANGGLLLLKNEDIATGEIYRIEANGDLIFEIPEGVTVNLGSESHDAALKSLGVLYVENNGTLNVTAVNNAIYGMEGVSITGGAVNIDAADSAAIMCDHGEVSLKDLSLYINQNADPKYQDCDFVVTTHSEDKGIIFDNVTGKISGYRSVILLASECRTGNIEFINGTDLEIDGDFATIYVQGSGTATESDIIVRDSKLTVYANGVYKDSDASNAAKDNRASNVIVNNHSAESHIIIANSEVVAISKGTNTGSTAILASGLVCISDGSDVTASAVNAKAIEGRGVEIINSKVDADGQQNVVHGKADGIVISGDSEVTANTREFNNDNERAGVYNALYTSAGGNVLISNEGATKEGYPKVSAWASSSFAMNVSGSYVQVGGTVDAYCYGHSGISATNGISVTDGKLTAESETNYHALVTSKGDITILNSEVTAKAANTRTIGAVYGTVTVEGDSTVNVTAKKGHGIEAVHYVQHGGDVTITAPQDGISLHGTHYSYDKDGNVRTVEVEESTTFTMTDGTLNVTSGSCAIRLDSVWSPDKEDYTANDDVKDQNYHEEGLRSFVVTGGELDLTAGGQVVYVNGQNIGDSTALISDAKVNITNTAYYAGIQVSGNKETSSFDICGEAEVNVYARAEGIYSINAPLTITEDAKVYIESTATEADFEAAQKLDDVEEGEVATWAKHGSVKRARIRNKLGSNMLYTSSADLTISGNADVHVIGKNEAAVMVGGVLTVTDDAKLLVEGPTEQIENAKLTDTEATFNKGEAYRDTSNLSGAYGIRVTKGINFSGNADVDVTVMTQGILLTDGGATLNVADNAIVTVNTTGSHGIYLRTKTNMVMDGGKVILNSKNYGLTKASGEYESEVTINGGELIVNSEGSGVSVAGGTLNFLKDANVLINAKSHGIVAYVDTTVGGDALLDINCVDGNAINAQGAGSSDYRILNTLLIKDNAKIDIDVSAMTSTWKSGIRASVLEMLGGEVTIDILPAAFSKGDSRIITAIDIQGNAYEYGYANLKGGSIVANVYNNYNDPNYTEFDGEEEVTGKTNNNRTFGIFIKNVSAVNFAGTDVEINLDTDLKNGTSALVGVQASPTAINITDGDLSFNANGDILALFHIDTNEATITIDGGKITGSASYFWNASGKRDQVLTVTPKAEIDFYCYSGDSRNLGTQNKFNGTYYNWYEDEGVEYLYGCALDDNSNFVTTANVVKDGAASQVEITVKEGSKTNVYVLNAWNRFYGGNDPETAKAYYTPSGIVFLNDLAAQKVYANGNVEMTLDGTSTIASNANSVLSSLGDIVIGGDGVLEVSGANYAVYSKGSEIVIGDQAEVNIIATKGNAIHINNTTYPATSVTITDDAKVNIEATESFKVGEDGKVSYENNGRAIYLRGIETSVNILGNAVVDLASTDEAIYTWSIPTEGAVDKSIINVGENAKLTTDSVYALRAQGTVAAINVSGKADLDLNSDKAVLITGADASLNVSGNAKVDIAESNGDSINIESKTLAPEGVKQAASMNVSDKASVVSEGSSSCGARIQVSAKDEDGKAVAGDASINVTGEALVDLTSEGQTAYVTATAEGATANVKVADKANLNLTNVSATTKYGSALTVYGMENNVEFTTTGTVNIIGNSAEWSGALYVRVPTDGVTNVLIKDATVNVTNVQNTDYESLNGEGKNTYGGNLSNAMNIAGKGEFVICGNAVVNSHAERNGDAYNNRAHGLFLHPDMSLKIADNAQANFSAGGDSKANTGAGIHLKESDITVTGNATLRATASGTAVAGITFEGESGLTVDKYGVAFIDGGKDAAGIRGYTKDANATITAKDGAHVLFTGAPAMNLKNGTFTIAASKVTAGEDKESAKDTALTVVEREYEDLGYVLLKGNMKNPNTSDLVITSVVIAAIVAAAAAVAIIFIRKKKSQD